MRAAACFFRRQPDNALQGARYLDDGETTVAAEGVFAAERHDEVEALVEDLGKRMRRVERDRRDQRRHLVVKELVQPVGLRRRPVGAADEAYRFGLELRDQHAVQHPVLLVDEVVRRRADRLGEIGRAEIVRAGLHRAGVELFLDAGDADLEKLVEIQGGDAEEPKAFEQRRAGVLGEIEHAAIEFDQAELPVDVELRLLEIDLDGLIHGVGVRHYSVNISIQPGIGWVMTTVAEPVVI